MSEVDTMTTVTLVANPRGVLGRRGDVSFGCCQRDLDDYEKEPLGSHVREDVQHIIGCALLHGYIIPPSHAYYAWCSVSEDDNAHWLGVDRREGVTSTYDLLETVARYLVVDDAKRPINYDTE